MKKLLKPEKRIPLVNMLTALLILAHNALFFVNDHAFNYEGKNYVMSIAKYLLFPYDYDTTKATFKGIPYQEILGDTLTQYSDLYGTAAWINSVVTVAACLFVLGIVGAVLCVIFRKKIGGPFALPVVWCLIGAIGAPMSGFYKLGNLFILRYAIVLITTALVFWNIVLCIKEAMEKKAEIKRLDAERDARWEADKLRRQQEAEAAEANN